MMFETLKGRPRLMTTTASRVIVTTLAVSGVDFLAAPALGYFRDHIINGLLQDAVVGHHGFAQKEGFLLPLILLVHAAASFAMVRAAVLRNPGNPKVGRDVFWGAMLSAPAIFVAFIFDELLYMQIPW